MPKPRVQPQALARGEDTEAGEDDVVLCLGGMAVERVVLFARGQGDEFHIDGMPAAPWAGIFDAAEGERHVLPLEFKVPAWRAAVFDGDIGEVDVVHGATSAFFPNSKPVELGRRVLRRPHGLLRGRSFGAGWKLEFSVSSGGIVGQVRGLLLRAILL